MQRGLPSNFSDNSGRRRRRVVATHGSQVPGGVDGFAAARAFCTRCLAGDGETVDEEHVAFGRHSGCCGEDDHGGKAMCGRFLEAAECMAHP